MSHGGDDEVHEEHEEHVNHEAWVIPYADLLTLLMAMFIALFAMSTVDVTKFKAFAIGFNEALGGGKLDAGIGGTRERDVDAGRAGATATGRSTAATRSSRRPTSPIGRQLQQILVDAREQQGAGGRATPDAGRRAEGRSTTPRTSSGSAARSDQAAEQRSAGHVAHRPGAVPERPAPTLQPRGAAAAERHRRRC